jgi:folylpolyglutamate synthase/dihydropteroate synthase
MSQQLRTSTPIQLTFFQARLAKSEARAQELQSLVYAGTRHPDAKMVRTTRWKYCYYHDGYAELYDIAADPHERTNLAGRAEMRDVEFNLRTRILNWLINSSEPDQIAEGLAKFSNDSAHNPGRLNLYRINGATVVLDFAHNEDGLRHLIDFASPDVGPNGRLIAIIGTAGDRTDSSLFELGRMAAERADVVIAKGTEHYLRGRSPDDLMSRYRSGAEAGGARN